MAERPPVIGLAGSIGAGKSEVARILGECGCVVSRSDEQARAALRDEAIRAELLRWWGEGVFDETGAVNRSAVAAIVFADPAQRRRLEALTHPWIKARRDELFAAAPAGTPALVIDAPLLFEAGLESACDAVIVVDAPRPMRLARLGATRGWDETELRRREESQLPLDVKRTRADYVIQNDGDLNDLAGQVRTILSTITSSSRA
jgi:dephospho-CoA kinase